MTEDDLIFLRMVRSKCADDPAIVNHIFNAAAAGMQDKLTEANERAADFEIVASTMFGLASEKRVSAKLKQQFNDLAENKLRKWHKNTFLNWGALHNEETNRRRN